MFFCHVPSAKLCFDEVGDYIHALLKAEVSAVQAEVVVSRVYPLPAGMRLVVSCAFPVGRGDDLQRFFPVGYAFYFSGVLNAGLLIGTTEGSPLRI